MSRAVRHEARVVTSRLFMASTITNEGSITTGITIDEEMIDLYHD